MAEPLKNQFGENILRIIGEELHRTSQAFDRDLFESTVREGFDDLELMPRAWKIADAMSIALPQDFEEACPILLESLGAPLDSTDSYGPTPFKYLPHTLFIARYGLAHFDLSMKAQYELTQRFTAEFSIRPFLENYPEQTLNVLRGWASDDNPHVRRLVSEGTRPRLPWAPRLRRFQEDPTPVIELLELLKDDSIRYVTRSVANNLNDIGKDHPDTLYSIARRWLKDAPDERTWLVKHALRSAIKRKEKGALTVLGFGEAVDCDILNADITPHIQLGDQVTISFDLKNPTEEHIDALVDLQIHFVKANQSSSPKVFKLKTFRLAPNECVSVTKRIRVAPMTTRKHYPGQHHVDVIINGTPRAVGAFTLS